LGKPYFGSGKVEKIVLNFTYIKLGCLIFCFLYFWQRRRRRKYSWISQNWKGKEWKNTSIYEMRLSFQLHLMVFLSF
jgi:hypothetical protein